MSALAADPDAPINSEQISSVVETAATLAEDAFKMAESARKAAEVAERTAAILRDVANKSTAPSASVDAASAEAVAEAKRVAADQHAEEMDNVRKQLEEARAGEYLFAVAFFGLLAKEICEKVQKCWSSKSDLEVL